MRNSRLSQSETVSTLETVGTLAERSELRFGLRGRQVASVDFIGETDSLMRAVAERFI